MQVFHCLSDWQQARKQLTQSIGFVPTMGCLHEGHAALLKAARQNNECVVLSIYVNPTQFNEEADLEKYPRPLQQDLKLAEELGVDIVLLPTSEEMYADNKTFEVQSTHPLTQVAEGSARPGHFTGVLTVVMKLLNLVQPRRVYFGEKDYQQCQLIQAMIDGFFMPIELVAVATQREAGKLALSSRNTLLSPEEKQVAEQFAAIFNQGEYLETIRSQLQMLPLELEYLLEINGRWLVAVRVGSVRLIDNRSGGK